MNRNPPRPGLTRRHAVHRAKIDDRDKASPVVELLDLARRHHRNAEPERAREICNGILAREPSHVPALNLLGLIYQESGRHRLAAKTFAAAIGADPVNAACHYNIASSYQALDRHDEAETHFRTAIGLGMSDKNVESFIFQNPAITACINRIDESWPLRADLRGVFGGGVLQSIAGDTFLRCALEMILVRTDALERFLTTLRAALLDQTYRALADGNAMAQAAVGLLGAVAQQCFINEYVFAQADDETQRANELRELLLRKAADGGEISPSLLAAVAAYYPLHAVAAAAALRSRQWSDRLSGLVRQQLIEPFAESEDRPSIPALTTVDDAVSRDVMQQYAENPYPRWTINPLAVLAGERDIGLAGDESRYAGADILIAGCGSGQHAFQVAQYFPHARVLAVDMSLPSLAYARRKTREHGLRNIDYAQADILKLDTIGRSFDRIEAVGVLHHLADPEAGWRRLLSLLHPGGEMRLGLYSETARRAVIDLCGFIAARGYRPTLDDIRKCRQEILRHYDERRWRMVIEVGDFYSTSGCRDLLFNVMEHRFTIARIQSFLREQRLSFLGFELEPWVMEKIRANLPRRRNRRSRPLARV
jgi:2-polyprenyl-3-methyl-5-hydroxy-6-metoxy-1,4-benzoquinol methylase/tetratricopeptide (TPR) repeat protein